MTFRHDRTLRDAVKVLRQRICFGVGLERPNDWVVGWWFGEHAHCSHGCATRAWEMLRDGQIFPEPTPPEAQ